MCQIPSPAFRHWEGFERGIWVFGCFCPAELPKGHGLKSLGESRSTKSLGSGVGGRGSSALGLKWAPWTVRSTGTPAWREPREGTRTRRKTLFGSCEVMDVCTAPAVAAKLPFLPGFLSHRWGWWGLQVCDSPMTEPPLHSCSPSNPAEQRMPERARTGKCRSLNSNVLPSPVPGNNQPQTNCSSVQGACFTPPEASGAAEIWGWGTPAFGNLCYNLVLGAWPCSYVRNHLKDRVAFGHFL